MNIRKATPDDADQLIAYVHCLADEPHSTVPLAPGEFKFTTEQERELLANYATAENSIYLVAEVGGRIIGVMNCDGGTRQATRHNASISISVAKDERNKGIGAALMSHLIDWAKGTGIIRRLDLEVYAHNAPAIHLYRKFGFVDEGKRQSAYFQHGQFIDGILMARKL